MGTSDTLVPISFCCNATQNGKKENGFCHGPCCARLRVGICVAT
jgi:hypothetical protein